MSEEQKNNDRWLKGQCNRYRNGQCATSRCLVRGGYVRGSALVNLDAATCEAHEILKELEKLRSRRS